MTIRHTILEAIRAALASIDFATYGIKVSQAILVDLETDSESEKKSYQFPLIAIADGEKDTVQKRDATHYRFLTQILITGIVAENNLDLCFEKVELLSSAIINKIESNPDLGVNVKKFRFVERGENMIDWSEKKAVSSILCELIWTTTKGNY